MCVTLQALYTRIFSFAQLPQREVAVDVATGSGQAAAVLAQTFDKASCDPPYVTDMLSE